MGDLSDTRIRVIKPGDVHLGRGDDAARRRPTRRARSAPPPMSVDDKFSFGLWQRDVQRRLLRAPLPRGRLHHRGRGRDRRRRRRTSTSPAPATSSITPDGQQGLLEEPHARSRRCGASTRRPAPASNPYIGPGGVLRRAGSDARRGARAAPRRGSASAHRHLEACDARCRRRPSRTRTVTVQSPPARNPRSGGSARTSCRRAGAEARSTGPVPVADRARPGVGAGVGERAATARTRRRGAHPRVRAAAGPRRDVRDGPRARRPPP